MYSDNRATAGHGGSGGAEAAAGEREFGEFDPGVSESAARHRGGERRAEREPSIKRHRAALELGDGDPQTTAR